MHVWKMNLRRTKSTIISWHGSCCISASAWRDKGIQRPVFSYVSVRSNVHQHSFHCLPKKSNTYRKFPKYSDTQKICCNHSKIWTMWLYHSVMSPNDADGMANSVDPDQTAPLGAFCFGSALFAQACLSENLGSLRVTLVFLKDYCM